eukprot:UN08994
MYIVGNATGGGLAILFALELIRRSKMNPNYKYNVVTFGANHVFACKDGVDIETKLKKMTADKPLKILHNMCHCFVNRLDPIPALINIIASHPRKMRDANKSALNSLRVRAVARNPLSKNYFAIGKQYIWCGKSEKKDVCEEMKIRIKHDIFTSFDLNWGKVPTDIWIQMYLDATLSSYLGRLENKYTLT